ncbi:rhomboid family intramembrane serine protease [Gaetbulibacter saemankumensis]|uniref:rhomboid family intramembrane serine protease n=1 Tax=Gaetbulibacter saemankumensis TaxID=311208 RepID=UPI00040A8B4F|nr:rhomboid family intramembrane serine protease [Gaetbulibacter saemankumensis]
MEAQNDFRFSLGVVAYPLYMVLGLWIIYWCDVRFGLHLSNYGIYPLRLSGLRGVVLSPFIHGSIKHLYHNSLPLLVLLTALFYFYRSIAWRVIVYGILISGLLTWLIGRPSYHIGASGLVYVLVSFIFFKGVFAKHFRLIALSLIVVFLYGSMIWYTLPIEKGISWEGHMSGFITGLLFAFLFKKTIAKPKKYEWEKKEYNEDNDPFLKHFDADGNFIEFKETDNTDDEHPSKINYIYKENKED